MAFDTALDKVVLFGGYTGTRTSGDTWVYAHDRWTNLTSTFRIAPPPRQHSDLVYDTTDGVMLLFGGHNGTTYLNDTWEFNGSAWSRVNSTVSPSPREDAMMADNPQQHEVVLFGGEESSGLLLGDTWRFSLGQWTNMTPRLSTSASPPAREAGAFTWDGADGYDLLFSGKAGATGVWNDTWAFDGTWDNLTSNLTIEPPKREAPSAIYDSADGFVLLFGGLRYPKGFNDTWTFSGGLWKELPPLSSPYPRFDSSMAYDPNDGLGYVLLFGGQENATRANSTVGDTWSFKVPLKVVIHATNKTIDLGNSTSFALNVTGGYPPYVANQWFGLPSGCQSRNQTVLACTPALAGTYNVTANVTDSGGFNGTSAAFTLQVNPDPVVTIHASQLTGEAPLTVNFTATIAGGTPPFNYTWTLGDGSTSAASSLNHTYARPGPYEAELTIEDARDVQNTSAVTIEASAPPTPLSATIGATPSAGTYPLPVQFSVSPSGGEPPYTYLWSFGSGITYSPTTDNPTYTYTAANIYEASVQVTDLADESVTEYTNITVGAPLLAAASGTPTSGVAPVSVAFTGSASGGLAPYTYAWTFGPAGATGSGASPSYDYTIPGVFSAILTVTDAAGDHATAPAVTVDILTPLSTSFTSSVAAPYCFAGVGEATVTVNATAAGGVGADAFGWSFPDGLASGANATTTVGAGANWTIQLTADDSEHHTATATQSVSVPAISCTSPAGSTNGHSGLLILILIVLVAAVIAVELVMILRRRKTP
jgi:PKD repeat protein